MKYETKQSGRQFGQMYLIQLKEANTENVSRFLL